VAAREEIQYQSCRPLGAPLYPDRRLAPTMIFAEQMMATITGCSSERRVKAVAAQLILIQA
jgi:hypothetical protein